MKIIDIKTEIKEYKFRNPIVTSKITLHTRSVFVVKLISSDGFCGVGAAYPLPPFTQDFPAQIVQAIELIKQSIIGKNFPSFSNFAESIFADSNFPPTLVFALELAYLNLLIDSGEIFSERLIPNFIDAEIKLNAIISKKNNSDFIKEVYEKSSLGFDTIKIKAGFTELENELIRLGMIANVNPNLKVRIDLNGAWKFEEAKKKLPKIFEFNIEYVEDPTNNFDDNIELARMFPDKIAFDQTAGSFEEKIKVIASGGTIILKPSFFGSIFQTLHFIREAKSYKSKIIISSGFEDEIGREVLYALATLLPNQTHGLDTTDILENENFTRYKKKANKIFFKTDAFYSKGKCKLK